MVFSINRRAFLRGVAGGSAIAIGLPPLEAMFNGNGTALAQGQPLPKRFGVWFWGNGIIASRWVPKTTGTGANWQLSEQLTPFANVKKNLTVLTGYDVKLSGTVHRIGPAGATFKSGMYIAVDAQGVQDIGWRVGPGVTVSKGPVEFSGPSDEVDMTFVGVFGG